MLCYSTGLPACYITVKPPCKELFDVSQVRGGTPYGATTIAGGDGSRQPSQEELSIARYQGEYVAGLAVKLNG